MAMLNNQMVHPLSQIFKWTPDLLNHGFLVLNMNGGRDGCSVLWKMANFFFSISMDWLQTWDQKPKISISHFPVGFPLMLFQLIYLHIPSKECIMVELRCGKKNCSSWSDEHISLSIVIHLSSCFFSVYIYIYTIIDIAIHLFVFVGVYIYNYIYIYIIVIAIYCYCYTYPYYGYST